MEKKLTFPARFSLLARTAVIASQSHPARKLIPPTGVMAPSQCALVTASR